jgi:methylthioribose-1-phosphate isomerase
MKVNGKDFRTIWYCDESECVKIIDQRYLPFDFVIESIETVSQMAEAIAQMHLRGAGLIGAAAAWGIYLAVKEEASLEYISQASVMLAATRPTAVNLKAALISMEQSLQNAEENQRLALAKIEAQKITDYDAESCRQIGVYGAELLLKIQQKNPHRPLQILTHCNAGWLAFVDYGSALSPVYELAKQGIDVHVYVDETRPRNQGAKLTAWELGMQGIPHTLIADNTGGHLMQQGLVDVVIVGADRISKHGDVANKIGTYLKALAAKDNNIPFVVAFPSTTYDASIENGLRDIPIEERGAEEVLFMDGLDAQGKLQNIRIAPFATTAANYGFDVTPARLVEAYITEKGVFDSKALIQNL